MSESLINHLGTLLAICGISCFRNFTPTFLLLLMARFLVGADWCPDLLRDAFPHVPAPMLHGGMIGFFGFFSIAEIVANWNSNVREIMEDAEWDKFYKPVYSFFFALVAGAPASPPENSPDGFPWVGWTWDAFSSGLSGLGTYTLCCFRGRISDALRMIDPENVFHLQTLARCAEETTWVAMLLVGLLVPVLAGVLVLILAGCALVLRNALRIVERRHQHPCPACRESVNDMAMVCSSCGAVQTDCHAVGLYGLAKKQIVDTACPSEVARHHRRLLMAHRCPVCASLLKDGFVCGKCHVSVWEQGIARKDLVRALDIRMAVILVAGFLISEVPVLGFVLPVMAMSLLVLNVLRPYEGMAHRVVGKILFRIIKWTLLILAVFLAVIPCASLVLLVPYLGLYYFRRRAFLEAVK